MPLPWEGVGRTLQCSLWVGDLCFILMGTEPGLGQEHQVDCIVINIVRDFTSFLKQALNNATHSPETEEWAEARRGTCIRFAQWTVTKWAAERRGTDKKLDSFICLCLWQSPVSMTTQNTHLSQFVPFSHVGMNFGQQATDAQIHNWRREGGVETAWWDRQQFPLRVLQAKRVHVLEHALSWLPTVSELSCSARAGRWARNMEDRGHLQWQPVVTGN